MNYSILVSNGEILDKFSILIIKQDQITDFNKLNNIKTEINTLSSIVKEIIEKYSLQKLYNTLQSVNQKLWNIEDKIRMKEKNQEFDNDFIQLARNVYKTNDERADVKKQINHISFSEIIEEKSYEKY
jgi:hypothetical protein